MKISRLKSPRDGFAFHSSFFILHSSFFILHSSICNLHSAFSLTRTATPPPDRASRHAAPEPDRWLLPPPAAPGWRAERWPAKSADGYLPCRSRLQTAGPSGEQYHGGGDPIGEQHA